MGDTERLTSDFSNVDIGTLTDPAAHGIFRELEEMARPAGVSSSEMSIMERRLRPIYDLLDGSNNKRAIQEVDRLLKKQPNFTCAKALKALALLRMHKPQECITIINPIIEENPVEDNVLQALSICYRELEQPEMVCQLYENACKIEPSEDLLTQLFLAYVRVGDFQNQYKAAMKLYKTYKKGPYFCWSIMSLVAQAVHDPSSQAARVSLPLAERMMAKFFDETQSCKSETEKELTLFMLILQKQRNYGRLLELLENTVRPTVSAITGLFHQLRLECLRETQQLNLLAQYLENSILGKPNEWQYYSEYLSIIESIGESRVEVFLNKVLDLYRSEIPPKSTYLAFFRLYDVMAKRNKSETHQGLPGLNLIQDYLRHYGHKASCVMDIAPFISALPIEEFTKLIPEAREIIRAANLNINLVRRHSNYMHLTRFVVAGYRIDIPTVVETSIGLVETYLKMSDKLGLKRHTPDCSIVAELMKLAALNLSDSFWTDPNIVEWVGVYQLLQQKFTDGNIVNEMMVSGRVQTSDAISNGVVQNNTKATPANTNTTTATTAPTGKIKYLIEEKDFPILMCCSILTFALDENSCSSQLRLILAKVYIRCGAIGAAIDVLEKLDLKYIQYESVGYIYMWKLAQCGFLSAGFKTLKSAETFYGVYQKESLEHILSAYKYGAWAGILEFTAFRKRLLNSVQSYLVRVESKLLEYLREGHSRSQVIQIKQSGGGGGPSIDCNEIPWDELTDGRDLRALKDYRANTNLDRWTEITFHADKQKLRIRSLILAMMNDSVGFMQEDNLVQPSNIQTLADSIHALLRVTSPNIDLNQFKVDQGISINAMWTPRLALYLDIGHPRVFYKVCMLILFLLDAAPPRIVGQLADDIAYFFHDVMITHIRGFEQSDKTLTEMADCLEDAFDVLENLGFTCILVDLMSHILNKELNQKERTKKKRAKEPGIHPIFVKTFLLIQSSVRNCYMELSYQVGRLNASLQGEYTSSICDELFSWGPNFGEELSHVLSEALPNVLAIIQSSYTKSLEEISSNIKSKLRYLNSIHLQSS